MVAWDRLWSCHKEETDICGWVQTWSDDLVEYWEKFLRWMGFNSENAPTDDAIIALLTDIISLLSSSVVYDKTVSALKGTKVAWLKSRINFMWIFSLTDEEYKWAKQSEPPRCPSQAVIYCREEWRHPKQKLLRCPRVVWWKRKLWRISCWIQEPTQHWIDEI